MLARVVALSGLFFTGCVEVGSGDVVEDRRALEPFSQVESSGAIRVSVEVGLEPGAVVVTDDNLISIVDTIVSGDTLKIRTNKAFVTRSGIEVHVAAPTLDGIEVSGSGQTRATGVDADNLEVDISGSGSVTLLGVARSLDARLSGSGRLDAVGMPVESATVRASGSGGAKLVATQKLDADVSGSGSVRYGGSPADVSQDVSGSGSVRPL